MEVNEKIIKIWGCIQHYDWGGYSFLPQLLNVENIDKRPFAELWFGHHPACPSSISEGQWLTEEMIAEETMTLKGLPYLCKILDVKDMLSIQLHPSKQAAEKGYEDESKREVSLTAFDRSFKDRNHKPELMYALSTFYLLHGFRETDDLLDVLGEIPALHWARDIILDKGLMEFYSEFMRADQEEVNRFLSPLKSYVIERGQVEDKSHPDFWALRALSTFDMDSDIDRGLLSIYLLKLLVLSPGEVVFQGAGIPHAYLEGQNVEVMSNSDNVIRGGLTKKYINHEALIQLMDFEDRSVHRLMPVRNTAFGRSFLPPVEDFKLDVYSEIPEEGLILEVKAVSVIFSVMPKFRVLVDDSEVELEGGSALVVMAGQRIRLILEEMGEIFCISVNH
ncbi:mannose-6-phosphate isomerase, class I [Membranihabitans marinus]|uniref:mannose-6-phosphate isomerase, class I n=1 Tax=Membranihabitans marinus TaxID=1227546 RepID=UPI001EFFA177|nr:mannose-6-phosphate isomerase, class I [Membranihabitans marinus]